MGKRLNDWIFGSDPQVQDFVFGDADGSLTPECQEDGFFAVTEYDEE